MKEENNMIAEFMGAKCEMVDHTKGNEEYLKSKGETQWLIPTWTKPQGLPNSIGWGIYQCGKFEYHSSWEWQIPAWAKLITLCQKLVSKKTDMENFKLAKDTYYKFLDRYEQAVCTNNPLEGFKVLIATLKWYNLSS